MFPFCRSSMQTHVRLVSRVRATGHRFNWIASCPTCTLAMFLSCWRWDRRRCSGIFTGCTRLSIIISCGTYSSQQDCDFHRRGAHLSNATSSPLRQKIFGSALLRLLTFTWTPRTSHTMRSRARPLYESFHTLSTLSPEKSGS